MVVLEKKIFLLCLDQLDLECGLKTIPVRCSNNHCRNRGICHMDILKNVSQCVCPSGKFSFFFVDFLFQKYLFKDSPAINVNMLLMNVNQIHAQFRVNALI